MNCTAEAGSRGRTVPFSISLALHIACPHSKHYSYMSESSVRVFKVKGFARIQRRERITDSALAKVVRNGEDGLVDADLGGGLVKQRIARPGQGKSGGFRTVIAYRRGDRAIFLLGFAKNERDNVDDEELDELKALARGFLRLNED
jgi:hypothetical protein